MKFLLLSFLSFFSLQSFALEQNLEIISSQYQVKDQSGQPTLCLTILRVPATERTLGLIEDIWDCHIARRARASRDRMISVDLERLQPVEIEGFLHHLQTFDADLEFYFSEGE